VIVAEVFDTFFERPANSAGKRGQALVVEDVRRERKFAV
jgi:hypothetical protein